MAIQPLTRYDNDVISGINNVIKEKKVTDLVIGLEDEKGFSPSFVYNLYNGYLQNEHVNVLVYHAAQPIATLKRHVVLIPENAEKEPGFFHALLRIWNIARSSGALISFYTTANTIHVLERILKRANIEAELKEIQHWKAAEKAAMELGEDEGLIVLMAKRGMVSYFPQMRFMPEFLNQHLHDNNYLLIYPFSQEGGTTMEKRAVGNHRDFGEISKVIGKLFK